MAFKWLRDEVWLPLLLVRHYVRKEPMDVESKVEAEGRAASVTKPGSKSFDLSQVRTSYRPCEASEALF